MVIALLPLDLLQDGSIPVEHVKVVTSGLHPMLLALLALPLMVSTLPHHPQPSFVPLGFCLWVRADFLGILGLNSSLNYEWKSVNFKT